MAAALPTFELKSLAKERSVADMRRDCARAFERVRPYHDELRQIYKYMMPWRQTTNERLPSGGGQAEGRSITDYVFDGTSMSAAANYAGQMLADWAPLEQDFFKLEAGPFVPEGEKHNLNKMLGSVQERVHAVAENHKIAMLEMFGDHFAGTGAMFSSKGDTRTLSNAVAVPMLELALETGPWTDTWHHYWRRRYRNRDIPALWEHGKVTDTLARRIREAPHDFSEIVQYTYFDASSKKWRFVVWSADDGADAPAIWEREFETNPWQTPKMFVVPGEDMGRGLGHLALPFTKTLNRSRELALKAAVFAILGIWLRRNDNVFNPDTAVFDPGAMWAVASTGGVLGPSIQRLGVPKDFTVQSIVHSEERENARRVLLDDELPDMDDAVRSPTEIAGRMRRHARNRGGTGMRLPKELITPYVQHQCEILGDWGHVPKGITLDQILTKCKSTAPAAAAMRTGTVEAWVNYVQIIGGLFGPQAAMLLTKIESIPEMGRNLGIPEKFLPGPTDLEKIQAVLEKAITMQQAAADQQGSGAKPPSPGQAFVNGGPH